MTSRKRIGKGKRRRKQRKLRELRTTREFFIKHYKKTGNAIFIKDHSLSFVDMGELYVLICGDDTHYMTYLFWALDRINASFSKKLHQRISSGQVKISAAECETFEKYYNEYKFKILIGDGREKFFIDIIFFLLKIFHKGSESDGIAIFKHSKIYNSIKMMNYFMNRTNPS